MKRWGILALIVIVLVAVIGGIKAFGIYQMIQGFKAQGVPKQTVSATTVTEAQWRPTLTAIGSLVAAGVLVPTSGARWERTWQAPEALAAVDAFAHRAGRRRASH